MGARAGCTYLAAMLAPWLVACSTAASHPFATYANDAAPAIEPQACACAAGTECLGQKSYGSCSDGGTWVGAFPESCPAPDSCMTQCPAAMPQNGSPCAIGLTYCAWPSACGAKDHAVCTGTTWEATVSPCACSNPARLTAGAPCSAPGTACIDPNIPVPEEGLRVLGLRIASCTGGRWTAATESVGSHCPPVEPAASDPCNAGDECEWENACGTWTSGTCIGDVWSKTVSACPGTLLESCTPGTVCEPRVNCNGGGCPTYPYCSCSDGGLQCMTASCPTP